MDRRHRQARELAQAADVLRHGLEEIEKIAPEPGEDDALDTLAKRLADADALRAAADEARTALVGDVTGDLGGGEVPQDATAALAVAERALASPTTRPWSCSPRTSPTRSPWCPTWPGSSPGTSPT